jgi:5-methylcytosine-specific restriction endonuclease McrBC regulatory subunit McrC
MKLTAEEKQLILEKRAEEESKKPKKHGVLKHDLYGLSIYSPELRIDIRDIIEGQMGYFVNRQSVDAIIEKVKGEIELSAPKGTKFDCYIDDGEELWYDAESIGIEEVDSEWAKLHLTIQ